MALQILWLYVWGCWAWLELHKRKRTLHDLRSPACGLLTYQWFEIACKKRNQLCDVPLLVLRCWKRKIRQIATGVQEVRTMDSKEKEVE